MLAKLKYEVPDVVISDIRMPGMNGIELLEKLKQHSPSTPVIIMTAYSELDHARITSYNVCYTKLLRRVIAPPWEKPAIIILPAGIPDSVSLSI